MDEIVKAIYRDEAVIYACDITGMAREMQMLHGTYPAATMALGRTLAGATLMCSMLKHKKDKLTVNINGGGPAGTLIVTGDQSLNMKAFVANPTASPEGDPLNVGKAVGKDEFMTVIKDLGLKAPYVGKVPLETGEIGEDFAQYFYTSEQQQAVVYLNTWVETDLSVVNAGGLIVLPLPEASREVIDDIASKIPQIRNYAIYMMNDDTAGIIKKIFGEGAEITETLSPRLKCDCSKKRLEEVLISLGRDEIEDMIEKDKGAEVTCRFCNKKYRFSEDELKKLLEGLSLRCPKTIS